MKKLLFLFGLLPFLCSAQDVTGQWNGALTIMGNQLRLVFHVSKLDSGYSSTMDSPDQGANGIPVSKTTFKDQVLKFEISNMSIEYTGSLKDGVVTGTFKQRNMAFPLNLSRQIIEKKNVARPQEPKKPYPYKEEEVIFENTKEKFTLAGTLTLPQGDGPFPAVVLISGSGAQNRDEELLWHKPFLVLADHLTQNGIAVLRYDDRGTAQSKGDFKSATTLDFAEDAKSAVDYLLTRKEINKKKIGLIGHSEGGVVAPIVANQSAHVAFIVLLAGTGLPGDQILLLQSKLISKASGINQADITKAAEFNKGLFEILKKESNPEKAKEKVNAYTLENVKNLPNWAKQGMNDTDYAKLQTDQFTSKWMTFFINYDPAPALRKIKCPVLALNGEKDLQVPADVDLASIKSNLEAGKNKNVTVKKLPNLNHLFQECTTGSPMEYSSIEQTFSPTALEEVSKWVNEIVRKR